MSDFDRMFGRDVNAGREARLAASAEPLRSALAVPAPDEATVGTVPANVAPTTARVENPREALIGGLLVEQPALRDEQLGSAAEIASNRMRRSSSVRPATLGHAGASARLDDWVEEQTTPLPAPAAPQSPGVPLSDDELAALDAEDDGKSAEEIAAELGWEQ